MLYSISNVITIYDYGEDGQSIIEISKQESERIDIRLGEYNELIGKVEDSKIEYTEEPISIIDSNGHFRFSRGIPKETAIFIYLEPDYIFHKIQIKPDSLDTDLFVESFDMDTKLIYAFFCSKGQEVTIRAKKMKDKTVKKKIIQSPNDLAVRRILLQKNTLNYKKSLLEDNEFLSVEDVATYLGLSKRTIQNKVSKGKFLKPNKVAGTNLWNREKLKQWMRSQ